MCEQGSFLAKIAVPTFELGFYAIVPDVCPHSVMAPKCIRIPAIEHTLVVGSLMLCEMSSCFKILKSSVAANLLAVERGCFQVATHSSMDFYTLKVLSTIRCGAKWICYKPDVNTFFALKLCALAALLTFGLLRHAKSHFSTPKGFYPMESIFLLLAYPDFPSSRPERPINTSGAIFFGLRLCWFGVFCPGGRGGEEV